MEYDRGSLDKFLTRALPVMESMLPTALRIAPPIAPPSDGEPSLSAFYATIPAPTMPGAAKQVRAVSCLAHRNSAGGTVNTVAVAYGAATADAAAVPEPGLVCVWDAQDTRAPTRTLRCAGDLTCCWIGGLDATSQITVVAAGTAEGSLSLWDISQARSEAERWPTYCTDSLLEENHNGPVVCIRECPAMQHGVADKAGVFGKEVGPDFLTPGAQPTAERERGVGWVGWVSAGGKGVSRVDAPSG